MRHREIKLPTTQCDVIEESSHSSTSWGRVGEDWWEERGACTQRYVYIQRAIKTYTKMAQTATIIT
jgi:hypothetical protein